MNKRSGPSLTLSLQNCKETTVASIHLISRAIRWKTRNERTGKERGNLLNSGGQESSLRSRWLPLATRDASTRRGELSLSLSLSPPLWRWHCKFSKSRICYRSRAPPRRGEEASSPPPTRSVRRVARFCTRSSFAHWPNFIRRRGQLRTYIVSDPVRIHAAAT